MPTWDMIDMVDYLKAPMLLVFELKNSAQMIMRENIQAREYNDIALQTGEQD